MFAPTIVMGTLATMLLVVGWTQGKDMEGLAAATKLFAEILPMLFFAMIVAGMMQTMLPTELVSKWIGTEADFKGIMLGAVAGGLTPGWPFVSMPIAAGLLQAGAGTGPMVAYMTGWSLWAIQRIPLEVGLLGWRFVAIRFAASLALPPLAGLAAHVLFAQVDIR